ncbi:MAG: nuclear transport factor 2 family protein, partial [Myxococcales bacterium]|nr:nuclear transport factor 2 family protein [Myxococcales bacterium]
MSSPGSGSAQAVDRALVAARFVAALDSHDLARVADALRADAVWRQPDGSEAKGREAILASLGKRATRLTQEGPLRVTRGTEVAYVCQEGLADAAETSDGSRAARIDVIDVDATGRVGTWLTVGGVGAAAPQSGSEADALQRYVEHVGRGDAQAVLQLFGSACGVEDPVGTPIHAGRAAVEKFYESGLAAITGTQLLGPPVVSPGVAAVPFRVELDLGGRSLALEDIDVMRFDDDGLSSSMRPFWGRGNRHE